MKKSSGTLGQARPTTMLTEPTRSRTAPRRRRASGRAALARRGRHPLQPPRRPRPRSASSRTTSASAVDAADAFNAALPHPELPAEPVRRRRAVGVVHPGLRVAGRARRARATPTASPAPSASLLALVVAVLVLAGVLATPLLIAVIAPGFTGEKRELTIQLVRDPVSRAPACWCCRRGASAC